MATDDRFDIAEHNDYQQTMAYREASRDERRRLNRYKKETGISDEHMFLLLLKRDLDAVPQERRSSSDNSSRILLVVAVLIFWTTMNAASTSGAGGTFNMAMWAIGIVSFAMAALVFYTGILNPYKRSVRKVNKRLKGMPEVVEYDTWCETHPIRKRR